MFRCECSQQRPAVPDPPRRSGHRQNVDHAVVTTAFLIGCDDSHRPTKSDVDGLDSIELPASCPRAFLCCWLI